MSFVPAAAPAGVSRFLPARTTRVASAANLHVERTAPVNGGATPSVGDLPTGTSDAVAGTLLLVKLKARPNMRDLSKMARGADRKQAAWDRLVETAQTSQQPMIAIADQLKSAGALQSYATLVSPNMLVLRATSSKMKDVVAAFSTDQVKAIYDGRGNPLWPAVPTMPNGDPDHPSITPWRGAAYGLDLYSRRRLAAGETGPTEAPYGINLIGAQDAWKEGATGKGLVYGSIDTGVDGEHEALKAAYRGRAEDGTVSHDYNWFDFSGASKVPVDTQGHGTHTTGTVLGTAPGAPIGVAPDAKWIAVNGLTGDADNLLKALQWMLAPTKVDGTAPNPRMAPDVVGMSWWTAPGFSDFFQESLQNLVAAGISPVKSAGNKGPGPETISSPGQFPEIPAVAAVDKDSQVAEFSSRGPSPLPHTGASPGWKPDVAAPGVDVISSVPGNKYASYSGTSMAQPHYSGAVLALMSRFPNLSVEQINRALNESAVDIGARGRDLEFGWGLINLPKALSVAAQMA